MALPAVTFRPATPDDAEFAYRVKRAAFRGYAEQVWGWNEEEQRRLHESRFAAQDAFVIQQAGADVGFLSTNRAGDHLDLKQLFVLPEHQGGGTGSACLRRLISDARRDRVPVGLQVLKVNPAARRFFERHGFRAVGETETHVQMRREVS
jgi:GNAT superfamily N-acetyltransferase